jgi:hypothetical protein
MTSESERIIQREIPSKLPPIEPEWQEIPTYRGRLGSAGPRIGERQLPDGRILTPVKNPQTKAL